MKFTHISFFLLFISFSQMTNALIIPDGRTGYVGEFSPSQSKLFVDVSGTNRVGGTTGINNTANFCKDDPSVIGNFLFNFPGGESGEYGLRLYNKNESNDYNTNNYLIGAINGRVLIQHNPGLWGQAFDANITLIRGKQTSISGRFSETIYQKGPLCWAGTDNRIQNSTLFIDSYSIYAVGNIKPGYYDFVKPIYWTASQTNTGSSGTFTSKVVPFSFDGGAVHVLRKCDITSTSPTNIQFSSQLANNYTSFKLLDKSIASLMVSCPDNGKLYVSLKPFGQLVSSSKTGMSMTATNPLKSNEVAPFISVSDGSSSVNDSVCNNNASNAFKFNDGQPFGSYQNGSIAKLLSFNLCAKGNIPANNYKGSIDVSILIE